jgi:hypothetical protein
MDVKKHANIGDWSLSYTEPHANLPHVINSVWVSGLNPFTIGMRQQTDVGLASCGGMVNGGPNVPLQASLQRVIANPSLSCYAKTRR